MLGNVKEKILKSFTSSEDMNKTGFLSSFFKTTPEDFTNAELVDIDIVREGKYVAPALTNLDGATIVTNDIFTGKQVRPPIYSLANPISLWDLLNRQPGESEYYENGNWFGQLVARLSRGFRMMFKMIKRSIELQAAQVLQTGTVDINDENGKPAYKLDFKMKPTHKVSVTKKWDADGAAPLTDLDDMCSVIQDDGEVDAAYAIFGKSAWNAFIKNADVQAAIKEDGINLGRLEPGLGNRGARRMGYINLGTTRLELITYNAHYTPFKSTTSSAYLDPKNVIVTASIEDLDFRRVYGGVPNLPMDAPFKDVVPEEITIDGEIRYTNRAYTDVAKNKHFAETTCRPICIPVSIDRFGCMTVTSK